MIQYFLLGIAIGIVVVNVIYLNTELWERMERK